MQKSDAKIVTKSENTNGCLLPSYENDCSATRIGLVKWVAPQGTSASDVGSG